MSKIYDKSEISEEYDKIKLDKIEELEMYLKIKSIDFLYPILNELKQEIVELKERLNVVEVKTGLQQIPVNISEINDVIDKVSNYLKNNKEAYPSDIADKLGLSIIDVMKAIQLLTNQQKIEVIE